VTTYSSTKGFQDPLWGGSLAKILSVTTPHLPAHPEKFPVLAIVKRLKTRYKNKLFLNTPPAMVNRVKRVFTVANVVNSRLLGSKDISMGHSVLSMIVYGMHGQFPAYTRLSALALMNILLLPQVILYDLVEEYIWATGGYTPVYEGDNATETLMKGVPLLKNSLHTLRWIGQLEKGIEDDKGNILHVGSPYDFWDAFKYPKQAELARRIASQSFHLNATLKIRAGKMRSPNNMKI